MTTPSEQVPAVPAPESTQRINIALNLDNWRSLPANVQEHLLWFHQHALDNRLSMREAADALGYDGSTVFRVLKGTYEGSWANICKAIDSYRKLAADRLGIQKTTFVENSISRLIFGGLDYAMANNSITLIVGESGLGKTIAAKAWRDANNHGRSVLVEVPPIGGTKALLRRLLEAVGGNKNLPQDLALEAILRAFNSNRCLILDEALRLLPAASTADTKPIKLELIRYLHDQTGCAVAFIATQRFDDTLKKLSYQYEQVLGRIGQPVRLYRTVEGKDFAPILQQYFKRPSAKLLGIAGTICNEPASGRIRLLAEVLKVASRIASKSRQPLAEEHFFKALALRRQMMGEINHAQK